MAIVSYDHFQKADILSLSLHSSDKKWEMTFKALLVEKKGINIKNSG